LGKGLGRLGFGAIFAEVSLTVAVLAGRGRGGALDTTGAEVGTFWKGTERLVEGETLPLFLKEHPSTFAFPSQDRPPAEPPEPP